MDAGTRRLAVIGGGRMGEAIVGGLVNAGAALPSDIVVADHNRARRDIFDAMGVSTVAEGTDVAGAFDILLLAVKPQVIDTVVDAMAPHVGDAVIVSIAGGVTCARLESHLPAGARVVRVMPNTPAQVGAAMSIISGGTEATEADVAAVADLFDAIGETVVLDESLQDACTAISGCGPAYVALVIGALARAGVREGIPHELAQRLALQTMRGTVELIEKTCQHPEQIIDAVSSPGGSTIAAVTMLEKCGVRSAFADAVRAAVERSRELGR